MSEYKRFTKRRKDGSVVLNGYTNCEEEISTLELILMRLAELEDKIEAGTLIELPCKVGDVVYFDVNWHRPTSRIKAFKVDHLEVDENYIRVACYSFENEDDSTMYRIDSKDIAFTKDEAEKKWRR